MPDASREERIQVAREQLEDLAEQADVLIGKLLDVRRRRQTLRRRISALERGAMPPSIRPRRAAHVAQDEISLTDLTLEDLQDDEPAPRVRSGRGGIEAAKAKLRAQGHNPDKRTRRRTP